MQKTKRKNFFEKPLKKETFPEGKPVLTVELLRKKIFSNSRLFYLFYENCCFSYKVPSFFL